VVERQGDELLLVALLDLPAALLRQHSRQADRGDDPVEERVDNLHHRPRPHLAEQAESLPVVRGHGGERVEADPSRRAQKAHGDRELQPFARTERAFPAACGGPIGIVKNGDEIEIDAVKNTISLNIPQEEYDARMAAYTPKGPGERRGVLGKYAALASSASEGGVTDKNL